MTMTATKLQDGGWEVSTIYRGYRVSRRFYGYTKRDALKMFAGFMRADFKTE